MDWNSGPPDDNTDGIFLQIKQPWAKLWRQSRQYVGFIRTVSRVFSLQFYRGVSDSQPRVGKKAVFPQFFLILLDFPLIFPQFFSIFFLNLGLWVGELPTREDSGYATAVLCSFMDLQNFVNILCKSTIML